MDTKCYDCGRNIPEGTGHLGRMVTYQTVDQCPECHQKHRRSARRNWVILIAISLGVCLCPVLVCILNELPRWIQEALR